MSGYSYDILLVNLPWWDMEIPYCAPAVLKGIVENRGYSFKSYNSSSDLLNTFAKRNKDLYLELSDYFISNNNTHNNLIKNFYINVVEKIKLYNAKHVGFSVFSVYTHKATLEILTLLRQRHPDIHIFVGGRGLTTRPHYSVFDQLTSSEKIIDFYNILKKKNLVDRVILGDGEDAIIDLLESNNSVINIPANKKLDYPFSNFDDLDPNDFLVMSKKIQLPVISSKGCVRSCDFCDVEAQIGSFKSKNGIRLAEEIVYLKEKYNINEFAFADSIANGNLKELKETCKILANYNQNKKLSQQIKWAGNWICRPEGSLKQDFFDLLQDSGCTHLTIGAEHGSDKVLAAMNKKTNVGGLYYELENLYQRNIQCSLNNIVGHWSETFEDFLEHLDMLLRCGPYFASRTITDIYVNFFHSLKNTPALVNYETTGIKTSDENFTSLWYSTKNPTNTYKTRTNRLLGLFTLANICKFPVYNILRVMKHHNLQLKNEYQIFNDFFDKKIDHNFYPCSQSNQFVDNVYEYCNKKIQVFFKKTEVELEVMSSECKGKPILQVEVDDKCVYQKELSHGRHTIKFDVTYNYEKKHHIKFSMKNKNKNDTVVDQQGNIIEDKCLEFKKIIIDKVDITQNFNYYYKELKYSIDNKITKENHMGLYANNSALEISFFAPFWQYYLKKQNIIDSIEFDQLAAEMKQNLKLLAH